MKVTHELTLTPVDRDDVTLDNWAEPPQNRWSLLHLDEVLATTSIAAARTPSPLTRADLAVLDVVTPRYNITAQIIEHTTVGEVLLDTFTDGFLVMHHGVIVCEEYARTMAPDTRHLLMSVTKTVVGVVAGALIESEHLRLDHRVEQIVPELAGSGFEGATVRDLMDMRSGVRFNETYHDPDADVYLMEHAAGWRSPRADVPGTLHQFLRTLARDEDHEGVFRYRSSETNALAWVCERASGVDLATLIQRLVWDPIGAEHSARITVDPAGVAVGDGGLCATLRDVARFAEMLCHNGTARSGAQVAPVWFIVDTLLAAEDSRDAFAATHSPTGMPGGHYRNQIWVPFPDRSVFLGLGIHGQMVYVNQQAGVVGVKLSTWPTAQNGVHFYDTLAAFESISAALVRHTLAHPDSVVRQERA